MASDTDRLELFGLLDSFADALDFKDWDLLGSLFTEDATTEWFGVRGQDSRSEIVAYISGIFAHLSKTHHIFGNYRATIDGDRGVATCRARAHHVGAGDKAHLFEESLASYEIRATRTPEGWRIAHLSETLFVMLGDPSIFIRDES